MRTIRKVNLPIICLVIVATIGLIGQRLGSVSAASGPGAETFTERPDLIVTLSQPTTDQNLQNIQKILMVSNYSWNEVAP